MMTASASQGKQRRRHTILAILGVIVVALIILRLVLPSLVRDYLNERLADMGDYRGHIDDVDLALWRGAYVLDNIDIIKISEEVPVPFFSASRLDLSISWSGLLQGAVVADLDFFDPQLHFVDGEEEVVQAGTGNDWRQTLQQLTAIEIDRLDIFNGQLHFHNYSSEPEVHLTLTDLQGSFTNLSNADRRQTAIYSDFNLEGRVLEDASVALAGNLDPLGDYRDFIVALRVTGIELTHLNDLTQAYGNFDFESGDGDFVMELEATDGELTGYARPLLDNVAILDLSKDLEEGVLSTVWEAIVGALGQIFRNQPADRIATDIEISGNLEQQDISTWQAFLSLLRNAFVEAYEARFRTD